MGCVTSKQVMPLASSTRAFQSDYEQLWAIPQDQQQLAQAVAATFESAPLPVYSGQVTVPPPPPPPYTTHASIGEVSIHRSYHNETSLDQEATMVLNGSQPQHLSQPGEVETDHEHDNAMSHDVSSALTHETEVQAQSIHDGYHPAGLDDQGTRQAVNPPPLAWLPATLVLPPHVQIELPMITANHPLATSTPSSSLSELNTIPNTADIFIRNELPPAPPAMSQSPPKRGVPLLRPIKPKNMSAPNLFVSYPATSAPENDMLNNTIPRTSRLPPLRRKTAPNLPEISHHIFNEDQALKLWPLPRSVSVCETIREVTSCEASTESVNNS